MTYRRNGSTENEGMDKMDGHINKQMDEWTDRYKEQVGVSQ